MILLAGESCRFFEPIKIERDTLLYLRYGAGISPVSSDGMVCRVSWINADESSEPLPLANFPIQGGEQSALWREAEINLSFLVGSVGHILVECDPGPLFDPWCDWLALADLCLARSDCLSLVRAKSFQEWRVNNEAEHFSQVYRQSNYADIQNQQAAAAAGQERNIRAYQKPNRLSKWTEIIWFDKDFPALPGESVQGYASRLMATVLNTPKIDFASRLQLKPNNRSGKVKVLSICCGAARFEAQLAALAGPRVEWSLLDINSDLLRLASRQFSPEIGLELITANVNELEFYGEQWDIIICVSALHHIVELERVFQFFRDSLLPDGEFWSLGEYIGRNGNRLWADAMAAANAAMRALPERLRVNAHTGQIDHELPSNDFASTTFEGIRSEEIEPLLNRWFSPVLVAKSNCFLWRLVNLAYCNNYDLNRQEDRLEIIRLINAELAFYFSGGKPSELYGVFKPRATPRGQRITTHIL